MSAVRHAASPSASSGPGIVAAFARANRSTADINHILLTHTHGDHVAGFPYFVWHRHFERLGQPSPAGMRVVAMFRVSTEKQANEGASLDAQQRQYGQLAAANNWTTVAEFRGSESATQAATERHVLQQALACIRTAHPDAIYVHEQSRLTRGDELEVALLFRELRERGVKIIVRGAVRDLASLDERFMLGIQSVVDRAESERIKERSRRGKRERARQGRKNCGAAPFGYWNPPPGDPRRGTLQVVPEKAAIIKRIFDMAASGMSRRAIASRLQAEKIPTAKGARWQASTIRLILSNPVYIGAHVSNAWRPQECNGKRVYALDLQHADAIIVPNAHEAIVSREIWDAVRARPKPPCSYRPHMLTGLLWVNGLPAAVSYAHDKPFYRCRDRQHKKQPWLAVGQTDQVIWDSFSDLAREPSFVESLIEAAQDPNRDELVKSEIQHCNSLIKKLGRRLERLVDMRADGEISKDEFLQRSSRTKQELAAAERNLQQSSAQFTCADQTLAERIVGAVRTVVGDPRKLDTKQKRRILGSVVRRIDVTAGQSGSSRPRGQHGRFRPGWRPRWVVREASFHLSVPAPDQDNDSDTTPRCRSRCRLNC